jgi:hypothetical protein
MSGPEEQNCSSICMARWIIPGPLLTHSTGLSRSDTACSCSHRSRTSGLRYKLHPKKLQAGVGVGGRKELKDWGPDTRRVANEPLLWQITYRSDFFELGYLGGYSDS